MSLRATVLARLASYSQHSFDTTCHTPFRDSRNEASIRVPRMFHSHVWQQYDKQIPCSVIQVLIHYRMTLGSKENYINAAAN
jgi:hypothetical protein